MKKNCWRYYDFRILPKITIMWCTVPEIQSETQNFLSFGPFFVLLLPPLPLWSQKTKSFEKKNWKEYLEILYFYTYVYTINEHHRIFSSGNVRCNTVKFLSFLVIFFLSAPWQPENQNFKIGESSIHDNPMMCLSCDMERDRQNILSFWIVFCPFTHPLTTQKRNILKKSKNGLEILSFYTGVPNMMCSPKIWSVSDKKFYYFGPFFALLPSNSPKNEKFLKNEKKKHLKVSSFYTSLPKIMIICHTVTEICRIFA